MEDHVGAYIIDSEGNAVPDLSDEAMAMRLNKLSNGNPPPVPPITTFEGKPQPAGDN